MNDTISDMLNRIYTSSLVGNKTVVVPSTKMTEAISEVLKNEGYIESFFKTGKKNIKNIEIAISYETVSDDNLGYIKKSKAVLEGFRRISKPSCRVYAGVKDFKFDRRDRTMRVLSTPKGVVTEKQAKEDGVGGEILFEIW